MADDDPFVEMENPGELTGIIVMDDEDDVPYLLAGDVGYDITLTKAVPLKDLMAAVGRVVIVKIDRIYRAGISPPRMRHIIVTQLTVIEPKAAGGEEAPPESKH
jgi:hypothetical protein